MSGKRVRLTMKQYNELVDSRNWCAQNGLHGFVRWYDEELEFQARRKALPSELFEQPIVDEQRPQLAYRGEF